MAKLTAAQRTARTIRRTAGGTFYVAAGATIAANVYASQHSILGAMVGLWTPVAFFLALELLERVPARGRAGWVRTGAIVFLALVAGYESYWHLVHVFTVAGADQVGRYAMPFTVDVLMVVARMAMNHKAAPSHPSSRRRATTRDNVRQLKKVA